MARNELRSQATRMANGFGVFADRNGQVKSGNDYVLINGKTYPKVYEAAYNKLLEVKKEKGFEELIEEVAYTWFNRFIALRFMEVNDYLPSHIRVLSSEIKGKVDPDILDHYEEADLDINFEEIYKLINVDKNSELAYRKLLIAQCNKLSSLMPFLFEKINDYTEMLLPDNLLIPESIISKLVGTISEEDFKEEVEIIGWIYQYYISEKKDKVFADLKKNIKISKENIPAATQLFTPKWIVKYMVENSLGRLWLEGHPNEELQKEWKYYLEEAEQEPEVLEELQKIKNEHAKLTPEDIKVLDPCMGSGHILVYAFDVLYEIYKTAGYSSREIPKLILKNNLYGLDIDDRAAQLASFALVMKARQYNKKIFKQIEEEEIELNLCSIQESNGIEEEAIDYFCTLRKGTENEELRTSMEYLCEVFTDAKEYGSLLEIKKINFEVLKRRVYELECENDLIFADYKKTILERLPVLIKQAEIISGKYEACVTNPPYIANKGMNNKLKKYLEENHKSYKSDLFSVYISRNMEYTKDNCNLGFMTPMVWMFLSSYEELRNSLTLKNSITSLIQLEYSAFEEATVPICIFTLNKSKILNNGTYIKLSEFKGGMNIQDNKYLEAVANRECNFKFHSDSRNFSAIPGNLIAFWISENTMNIFKNNVTLGEIAQTRQGMATSNNDRFLRLWYEIEINKAGFGIRDSQKAINCNKKWFPYNKGGAFRKWYGNNEYLVNWECDGKEIKDYAAQLYKSYTRTIKNIAYYFRKGITWSMINSSNFGARYTEGGYIFDIRGSSMFFDDDDMEYIVLAFLSGKIASEFLKFLSPTISFEVGTISKLPIIKPNNEQTKRIKELVGKNINISREEWNSFETAWDFKVHSLFKIPYKNEQHNLESVLLIWEAKCEEMFEQLKYNEEELNRIFIDIYGLQDELTPEVDDKYITIRKADREIDIKSLISYAVGCMLGRYSIDAEGLIYAGGDFSDKWNIDEKKVRKIEKDEDGNILSDTWVDATFMPDMDNTIPVTENEYFGDDIVARFVEFIKTVYGEDTLEENLDFIADTLVKKNNETSRGRIRRYFVDEFYNDHCKIYQKRPIYWMIDSGKNKGFKSLIYLHRYNKETLSNVRLNYLLELQGKYLNEQKQIERYLDSSSISVVEKKKRSKELQILSQKQAEILAFDKVLDELANKQIELDLDDGVVVNYGKLQGVLAKIK